METDMGELDQVLREIDRTNGIERDDKKASLWISLNIIEILCDQMRKDDELFNSIYKQHRPAGSYIDDVKVDKPDEYDFNLILDIGECETVAQEPGFAFCEVDDDSDSMEQICHNGKLHRQKMKTWFEQCVTKACNKIRRKKKVKISAKAVGPAMTITCYHISIDLVPAVEVQLPDNAEDLGFEPIPYQEDRTCTLICKPPSNNSNDNSLFRISFHRTVEEDLMEGKKCLKPLIRIFKVIRNDEGEDFKQMSSYFIKTFFLNHAIHHNDEDYWRDEDDNLAFLFMRMLRNFILRLKKMDLPSLYFQNFDMLGHISDEDLQNMLTRMNELYMEIEQDPSSALEKYIKQGYTWVSPPYGNSFPYQLGDHYM